MFSSRCGINCTACEGKKDVQCKGCTNMNTPFWGGECGVKSCCENKQLSHCGECPGFPCEMLAAMGKEQGYNPAPRLENLRRWAGK